MADLSRQYEEQRIEAETERIKLINSINQVSEPYRTILFMRYVEDLSLEAIAARLNYSYSIIAHLHGDALVKFERRNMSNEEINVLINQRLEEEDKNE